MEQEVETPEARTQSRDKRETSEPGSTEEESGTLQKVAEGDMRVAGKEQAALQAVLTRF